MHKNSGTCSRGMADLPIVLDSVDKIEPWINDNAKHLQSGKHAKEGDIVVCSIRNNWGEPTQLGKVLKVHKPCIQLSSNHPDGKEGHIFVLPFDKQRLSGKKKLIGTLCILYSLGLCLCIQNSLGLCLCIQNNLQFADDIQNSLGYHQPPPLYFNRTEWLVVT